MLRLISAWILLGLASLALLGAWSENALMRGAFFRQPMSLFVAKIPTPHSPMDMPNWYRQAAAVGEPYTPVSEIYSNNHSERTRTVMVRGYW